MILKIIASETMNIFRVLVEITELLSPNSLQLHSYLQFMHMASHHLITTLSVTIFSSHVTLIDESGVILIYMTSQKIFLFSLIGLYSPCLFVECLWIAMTLLRAREKPQGLRDICVLVPGQVGRLGVTKISTSAFMLVVKMVTSGPLKRGRVLNSLHHFSCLFFPSLVSSLIFLSVL